MVNRSNFPTSVDQFSTLVDILASDKTNVERYQTLLMQATRTTEEETELTNLKNTLVNKIISSEHINFITDSITSMQDYYLNEVVAHLATLDVGALQTELTNHKADTSNPHNVTKSQVGLGNVDNIKQATKTEFDNHTTNNSNPHGVTAAQVGSYTKAETESKFVGGTGERIEIVEITFSISGSQANGSANFAKAFSAAPAISPAHITLIVSYGDDIKYPYIYNVTNTGFWVRLNTTGGASFGAEGALKMKFVAIGK